MFTYYSLVENGLVVDRYLCLIVYIIKEGWGFRMGECCIVDI